MIVYEFYLRKEFNDQAFEALCEVFYALGGPLKRKVDGGEGPAVYSVSQNPATNWVQLLVDDNTPAGIQTAIESRINSLSDGAFEKLSSDQDSVAPMERRRGEKHG